ncbi:hypothetical protein EYF80_040281 [Liparis tanakae]|uniref:Uncharacterized protein n=1 Tax=Liparis tanakae TaxID=230148 RepID=A0A4Z2G8D5_9TELE|nr:hypothetical protein EYF80_040281 [Liparis tanakae]
MRGTKQESQAKDVAKRSINPPATASAAGLQRKRAELPLICADNLRRGRSEEAIWVHLGTAAVFLYCASLQSSVNCVLHLHAPPGGKRNAPISHEVL